MYIVSEIQTNENGQVAVLTDSFDNINAAEQKFHYILSFAAVSNLPTHAAVMYSEEGFPLRNECYKHDPVPAAPEVVEEPAEEEPAEVEGK